MQLYSVQHARFEENLVLGGRRIDNHPVNDFKIVSLSYGKAYVHSALLNLQLEIPEENLFYLFKEATIVKGAIQENAILVLEKQKFYLLIEGTEEYSTVIENSQEKKTSLAVGKEYLVHGNVREISSGSYMNREQRNLIYVGRFFAINLFLNARNSRSYIRYNSGDYFFYFYDKEEDSYFYTVSRGSFVLKKETGFKTTNYKNKDFFPNLFNERSFYYLRQKMERKEINQAGDSCRFIFSEKITNYRETFKNSLFFPIVTKVCKDNDFPFIETI